MTKFKPCQSSEIADDKRKCDSKIKLVSGGVENTVGKGENAGELYQHFLLFPLCFQKASNTGSLKSPGCVVKS